MQTLHSRFPKTKGERRASVLCALGLILSVASSHADDLTTTNVQPQGTNWNAAIWQTNGSGIAMAPEAGNTYQTVFNGTLIGPGAGNARIRNPAVAGVQNFSGDSLTLNTNTELRAKGTGSILNFPGVNGNPGLILNGGMLNGGDDTTIAIAGTVLVASPSYISQGSTGGGGNISSARAFNFTGPLTGTGDMVILDAGTNVPQTVSSASNTFSGQWIVRNGWLLGAGAESLGTNNLIADPLYSGYLAPMPNFTATNGEAWIELGYDLNSPASLILTNGGKMKLHQNCVFNSVLIEGTPLSAGTHAYSQLATDFPNSFLGGGIGSITVQPYGPPPVFPPTLAQTTAPAAINVFNGGSATFSAAFIGTPPIAYQWRFTTNLVDYRDVPGATNTTLVLTNLQSADAGYYSLWASNTANGGFTVGSGEAQVGLLGTAPGLKPFPLSANGRGTVSCLENPSLYYDIYLPPAYATNGPPLPIIYTMWAAGGGMVTRFQDVCSNLNVITVGLTNSRNNLSWEAEFWEFYAATLDIRQRVLFDPTAEFVSGESGGGECSFLFSRLRSQHVSGVLGIAGWLGRTNRNPAHINYFSTDRLQTNLFVARTTGTTDLNVGPTNPWDSNFLARCGVTVRDWTFVGGHGDAPADVKLSCLQWLISQRTPAALSDPASSLAQAADWRSRIAAGESEDVLRECVATLMNRPRTWFALEAELVLDDLMANYNTFRALNVSNLFPASGVMITNPFAINLTNWSQSDFAADLFYYAAYGAATNHDWQRYDSCLKALTGIAGVNGDHAGDIYFLLTNSGYAAPIVQVPVKPTPYGPMTIWLQKDTPGLSYSLQWRTNLLNSVWSDLFPSLEETDTIWSGSFVPDPGRRCGFYRMSTTPVPATSPPWPL